MTCYYDHTTSSCLLEGPGYQFAISISIIFKFKQPHRSTSSATKQYNTAWILHAITMWYSLHRGHPQTSTKIRSRKWKHLEFPALNRRALLPQRTAEFKHQHPLHPNGGGGGGGGPGPNGITLTSSATKQYNTAWILHAITMWYSLHRGHPQTSIKSTSTSPAPNRGNKTGPQR